MNKAIRVFPTRIDALDEEDEFIFSVEVLDDTTVSVEVKALCTLEQWDEMSRKIRDLIVTMHGDMAGVGRMRGSPSDHEPIP